MMMDTLEAESTSGRKNVERKKVRSQLGILDWMSTARPIETLSCRVTATATKPTVFRNALRMVGSAPMETKLSTPTNSGALMMSQRKNARVSEATMGTRVKMA